jgi:hypothetical protein
MLHDFSRLADEALICMQNISIGDDVFIPNGGGGDYPEPPDQYRLHYFLKTARLLWSSAGRLDSVTFSASFSLYESLLGLQRDAIDYNVLSCVRLLSSFPPELFSPHFSAIYCSQLDRGCSDPVSVFSRFKGFFAYLGLPDLQAMIAHPAFAQIASGIVHHRHFEGFAAALATHRADPMVKGAIIRFLETPFDREDVSPAAFRMLTASVIDCIPSAILSRFADFIFIVLTPAFPGYQDHVRGTKVKLACAFAELTLPLPGIADFVDWDDLEQALPRVVQFTSLSNDGSLVLPVAKLVATVCRVRGQTVADAVLGEMIALLDRGKWPAEREAMLSMIFGLAVANPLGIGKLLDSAVRNRATDAFFRLAVGAIQTHEAAMKGMLAASMRDNVRLYGTDLQPRAFLEALLGRMTLEEAKVLVGKVVDSEVCFGDAPARVIQIILNAFPDDMEELCSAIPNNLSFLVSPDQRPVVPRRVFSVDEP